MWNQKNRKAMEKLDKCYQVLRQSGKNGMSAIETAKKLGVDRTTAHSYLNTLEGMRKVKDEHGIWYAITEEETIKPLEKEVVITLPLPKEQTREVADLETDANKFESQGYYEISDYINTILEKLKETRTIRITTKNLNDLDLQQLENMIRQANENASNVNPKDLAKGSKSPQTEDSSVK